MKEINSTFIAAIISACLCFALSSRAQDVHFSMPYSSLMNLNPSFAGSSGCSQVTAGYRNQWPNISGNYVTSFLSCDQYIKALHGGIGINYTNDLAGQGAMKKNTVSGVYSAYVPVFENKFILSPSIQGAYVKSEIGNAPGNIDYFDISAGMLGFNKHYYGGLAVFHLTRPYEDFAGGTSRLPMRYATHFGVNIGNIDSIKSFSFSPSIIYCSQQDFRSFIISCAAKYDKYLLGIGYRNGDAIIGSLGFRNKVLRLSYSYDITVSKLGLVTGGSHELAFSFLFNRKHKPKDFMSFSTAAF